jgi:hypothetical protein
VVARAGYRIRYFQTIFSIVFSFWKSLMLPSWPPYSGHQSKRQSPPLIPGGNCHLLHPIFLKRGLE